MNFRTRTRPGAITFCANSARQSPDRNEALRGIAGDRCCGRITEWESAINPTRQDRVKICSCRPRARRQLGRWPSEDWSASAARLVDSSRLASLSTARKTSSVQRRVPILLQEQTDLLVKPAAWLNVCAAAASVSPSGRLGPGRVRRPL